MCITLKDEIDKLIHHGYLQDYINNRKVRPQNDAPEAEPPHEIRMIFGRPHFAGETRGTQERYVRETKSRPLTNVHSVDKQPAKQCKGENDNITFKESDAHLVHHLHCDALVIKGMMANNNVYRILVDNGSSVDILYYQAFQRMGLRNNDLRPSPNPIYSFTRDSVVLVGVITLPLTVAEYVKESCVMTDFLVIDQPSTFNAVLGRPSLRALKAITNIYHLLMKFPTPFGVGQMRGNQEEARRCYNQAIKSASRLRQVNVVDQRPPSKGPLNNTIDPRSPDEEATTGPIKDLVDLSMDDKEPTKVLKLEKNLSDELREAISTFLKKNLDVFAWKHSDMEGIDPAVM